jgi:glycosyltransferase involved in cell wall biosynthesis
MINDLNNIWGKFNYLIELFILRKADLFITISESAKNDIVKTMNIPREKMHVVYNGANCISKTSLAEREGFYLYVGGLEERKNIVFMVRALEKAQELVLKKIKLVCVSRISSATSEVLEELKKSTLDISIKENISDDQLGELYKTARALINPSLYEGFGLPIVEAMQAETPTIISNVAVFQEISGGYAHFFDPLSAHELTDLITRIEKEKLQLDQFVSFAKKHVEQFSWSTMAKKTLGLYKKLYFQE